MFKKHVHNGKILINSKRKGLDTKSCVCKGKTVKYVILPLFTNLQTRNGIHQNNKNGMCVSGNIAGQ